MSEKIHELKGGNMDIDLLPVKNLKWEQDRCPWNIADGKDVHKCAVKNVSICDYFRGIKDLDTVLCTYKIDD